MIKAYHRYRLKVGASGKKRIINLHTITENESILFDKLLVLLK